MKRLVWLAMATIFWEISMTCDVVVAAEFSPASIQAALYCACSGARLVSWSETTPQFEQYVEVNQIL